MRFSFSNTKNKGISTMKKLNLGCGNDIRRDYVNLDIAKLPGVDVVFNIESGPLPFGEETFDEILCLDILEHLDYIPILKEMHRVLKKGGKVTIRVPHFTSNNNYIDPTHKKMFSIKTFEFFTKNSFLGRSYYFDFKFEKLLSAQITFQRGYKYLFYNGFVQRIFGKKPKFQIFYELTLFSRMFPALNIEVELEK